MSAHPHLNLAPSWALFTLIVLVLLATGHINQLAHYHDFADQTRWLLLPNGKDVWSNVGLILVGAWAVYDLKRTRTPFTGRIWHAYRAVVSSRMVLARSQLGVFDVVAK